MYIVHNVHACNVHACNVHVHSYKYMCNATIKDTCLILHVRCIQKFSPGESFHLFHLLLSWAKIFILQLFCPMLINIELVHVAIHVRVYICIRPSCVLYLQCTCTCISLVAINSCDLSRDYKSIYSGASLLRTFEF